MKKILLTVLLSTALLAGVFANAAAESAPAASINTLADLNGKVIGMANAPMTPEEAIGYFTKILGVTFGKVEMFPSINEALAALKAGRVDGVGTTMAYAKFLSQSDNTVKPIEAPLLVGGAVGKVSMVMLESNAALLGQINNALSAITSDGTLASLNSQYIDGSQTGNPAPVSIPVTAGEQTVKVGISGDYPPFDYIQADGKPAGYNTALMAEIAKREGFNVEFITVPFDAKFSALNSGRIDVFFFHAGVLASPGIVTTDVYYNNLQAAILVKK
ncbi:MAG: transporter substrate-binding domain-containing protein [Spirochaetaceae bacterium]|jgi:ABC-type amino acid transport substrate-binding protein|nr:transporter substrate-binding domain-containing protein [Spirochaetaceae bacterium]